MSGDEETVFCTECGAEISPTAAFCPECGAEQVIPAADDEPAATKAESTDAAPATERSGGDGTAGTAAASPSDAGPAEGRGDDNVIYRLPGLDAGNTTRRNVLVGAGYSLVGLAAIGAAAGPQDGAGGGTGTTGGDQYPSAWAYHEGTGIALRNVGGSVGSFSVEITGVATNESGQDYSYVQLGFALYDSSGAKVGDALANTSGLGAGQRWRFEAVGTNSGSVDSFSLEEVSAF